MAHLRAGDPKMHAPAHAASSRYASFMKALIHAMRALNNARPRLVHFLARVRMAIKLSIYAIHRFEPAGRRYHTKRVLLL